MQRTRKPFGSWRSPLGAAQIAASGKRLGDIHLTGDSVYWQESRPAEKGRTTLMRRQAGQGSAEILPAPYNVRSRVHEYGGGAFGVFRDEIVFVNDADRELYRISPGSTPQQITREEGVYYADLLADPSRERLILIREDHRQHDREAQAALAAVDLKGDGKSHLLDSGCDFYASPCLDPAGRYLAWLTWDHPHMPWDETTLWLAEVQENGNLGPKRKIAGGAAVSIFQPQWSPDGMLYFVSDQSGWWNLYRFDGEQIRPVCPMPAEFGLPQWVFGMSTYGFVSRDVIIAAYTENGNWFLAEIEVNSGKLFPIDLPFTYITQVRCREGEAVFIAASPLMTQAVVCYTTAGKNYQILSRSAPLSLEESSISVPRPIEFSAPDGTTAYGFYYPPVNKEFRGLPGEKPPLIIFPHSGPTAAAPNSLRLKTQYWTSRGFAAVDVNYRGSTGFGRTFRELLYGAWGVGDVQDCLAAARFLVDQEKADPERLIISGSSAAGFTVLAALAFHDLFQAGASHYGISDLQALTRDTHKFESRYNDRLLGADAQHRQVYRERSPLFHAHNISAAVIFFQGEEDRVVLPDQTRQMVEALRKRGAPVACRIFPEEGHGFRQKEHIREALEMEYAFYTQIFGLATEEILPMLHIDNFTSSK